MSMPNTPLEPTAELCKFCKFFTNRVIQTVVQSRMGIPIETRCKATSEGADWFNLRIDEFGDITSQIKSSVNGVFPPTIPQLSLCFELRTVDGRVLPLEVWRIRWDSDEIDEKVGVRSHLYHQMGTLLKSAMTVSRLTPTYRHFVSRQSSESFIICYEIIAHESVDMALPDNLGNDKRCVNIGHLPSPYGTLSLDMVFRTEMVISEENKVEPGHKNVVAIASSHDSGTLVGSRSFNSSSTSIDQCYTTFSTSPPTGEYPWSSVQVQPPAVIQPSSKNQSLPNTAKAPVVSIPGPAFKPSSLPHKNATCNDKVGQKCDFPFSALLTASSAPIINSQAKLEHQEPKDNTGDGVLSARIKSNSDDILQGESSDDSFVKVEAPVFATHSPDVGAEVEDLLERCRAAPNLAAFESDEAVTNEEQIKQEMRSFQEKKESFDSFLLSLERKDFG